jgi:hypothetical protein
LIGRHCDYLFIDKTQITHMITRISDDKRRKERVDIIFDYGVPINDSQPRVLRYNVSVEDSDLTATQLSTPHITPTVNRIVEVYRLINRDNNRNFPI